MEEIWVDIKGYENKYQLSNKGQVKSLNYNNTGEPKLLKIKVNRYGYNEVCLSKGNKRKAYLLITLVAEHFLNKPSEDMIPIHIGDVQDDRVENIAYGYRSEVNYLMYKKGRRKTGKPSRNICSYKGKQYAKFSQMARDYGINDSTFRHRLEDGWTLEEALEIPKERKEKMLKKKLYLYNGSLYSIKQLCEISGINENTLRHRLKRGWSIEETMGIPVSKMKGR